jgi:hypothetical protein
MSKSSSTGENQALTQAQKPTVGMALAGAAFGEHQ